MLLLLRIVSDQCVWWNASNAWCILTGKTYRLCKIIIVQSGLVDPDTYEAIMYDINKNAPINDWNPVAF